MPEFNFNENLKIGHLMGNYALEKDKMVKRFVSENDFRTYIGNKEFEIYKPLFDYMDRHDNKNYNFDGCIDIACFGDKSKAEEIEGNKDILYTGEMFYDNRRAEKLSAELNVSLELLQDFFMNLTKICGAHDRINVSVSVSKDNRKEVTKYNEFNKPLEAKYYDDNDNLCYREEFVYNKSGDLEKKYIFMKDNMNASTREEYYSFNTEEDADNFIKSKEDEGMCDGIMKEQKNGKYIVTIEYSM